MATEYATGLTKDLIKKLDSSKNIDFHFGNGNIMSVHVYDVWFNPQKEYRIRGILYSPENRNCTEVELTVNDEIKSLNRSLIEVDKFCSNVEFTTFIGKLIWSGKNDSNR